ncbi:unnamed protein product [Rotaria sp. Silwood1]|nr:unnamed protein product [Rotaria sp. Silwood1]
MQNMYEFYEIQYQHNPGEQKFLNTFKETYSFHSRTWWYSQELFLYQMLNKAFRIHQYDNQLQFFCGQIMDKVDFDHIRMNEGGLSSISKFLSMSSKFEVGLRFARDSLYNRKKVNVLMKIIVDRNMEFPLVNVTGLAAFKDKQEWLSSMGLVFCIDSFKYLSDRKSVIPLTSTDDSDEKLSALRKYFKKSMEDKNPCMNFTKLLNQLAAWERTEYFYLMTLKTEAI